MSIYKPIKILPLQVSNQIAAGEVVDRPSSIIKEILENSIDAKATEIKIEIDNGGVDLIKVTDNGTGIKKEDMHLALMPHATSKLSDIIDLDNIISYGFRGEALASISSVSKLTITSKTEDSQAAWQVTVSGKEHTTDLTPASHINGTTIEIKELFFNVPARRKFLKNSYIEYNHCEDVIKKFALINPEISWHVYNNGKLKLRYPKVNADDFISNIKHILNDKFSDNSLVIENNIEMPFKLSIKMILEIGNLFNSQAQVQYIYINNRIVRDKVIVSAIKQSINDSLGDIYYSYILNINIDPNQIDVNVHPSKLEIRFKDARSVHNFIYQSIINLLVKDNIFSNNQQRPSTKNIHENQNSHDIIDIKEFDIKSPNKNNIAYQADITDIKNNKVDYNYFDKYIKKTYQKAESILSNDHNINFNVDYNNLDFLNILSILDNKILLQKQNNLYLIEKDLFIIFYKKSIFSSNRGQKSGLLSNVKIPINKNEYDILNKNSINIRHLFDIEIYENYVIVKSVPDCLKHIVTINLINELIKSYKNENSIEDFCINNIYTPNNFNNSILSNYLTIILNSEFSNQFEESMELLYPK